MHAVVLEGRDLEGLKRERARTGADRWDEVWEGILHMAPAPSTEHQRLEAELLQALVQVIRRTGRGTVFSQANVADPVDQMDDYRVPDIAVVLHESTATIAEHYISGGPDLVVEIRSPNDETYEKISFYERLGVRELLIIDRDEKSFELYRQEAGRLTQAASGTSVISDVTNLTFETVQAHAGNQIQVRSSTGQHWLI